MTEPQQPTSKGEARANAAADKARAKSQRPWVLRHKILTALAALFAIGVISTIANSGSSMTANSNASDPLTTASTPAAAAPVDTSPAAVAPAPADTSPAAAAPAPAANGRPSDKGWVLQSFQTKDDGVGDFGGTARITNTNTDPQTSATFKITLARGGTQIASLSGSASSVAAGKTVTVDLISTDKYSAGPTTSDFQTDVSYAG